MASQGLISRLERLEDSLVESECAVHGFSFTLGVPGAFDPYTNEAMELAGFTPCATTEATEGFFYLTDEYKSYLADLINEKGHHPGNVHNRIWIEQETDDPVIIDARGVCSVVDIPVDTIVPVIG